MFPLNRIKTKGSARSQIGIKEVRDGILILPNNRYRLILATSSLNFELQSAAEQDVIIDTFQSFLNSLTTPIQILIRVRELDIDRYLEELRASRTEEKLDVYRKQLDHYSNFIKKLVAGNKILSRRFYLVIPYENKTDDFYLAKEQLQLEQEIIIKGLEKLGMTARSLNSLEILDLFYSFYRPEQAKTQPLTKEIVRQTNGNNLF
ncbi:MAG: TraC family protein [Candidatus Buchananbacteria bacterium]|nr:TraC family protein [Candidatus Buchananbacteria bacterium]